MSTVAKQGTFTMNTSPGNQTVSGIGFQPKLVILWVLQQATISGANEVRRCYGAATSSTAQWMATTSVNPWNTAHDRQVSTARVLKWLDADSNTTIMEATFVAMTSDGFTINVNTGVSVAINYLAIGGSSFSAKVGSFDTDGTFDGLSQSVTGVGFTPKALMVVNGPQVPTLANVEDSDGGEGLNFGFATAAAQECNSHWSKFDGGTIAKSSCTTGSLITMMGFGGLGYDMQSHLTSLDSGGFTILHDSKWTGSVVRSLYIAFGGNTSYKVGSVSEPGATGSQTINAGLRPAVELFMSTGGSNSTGTIQTNSRFSFGAAVNSSQAGSIATFQPETVSSATSNSGATSTALPLTRKSASTFDSSALMTVQNSAGYILNWTAVSGASVRYTYFAIGDPPSSAARNMFMCFH